MKNKFVTILVIVICLSSFCISEATTYKNNLVHYIAKQKNKIPSRYRAPTSSDIANIRQATYWLIRKDFAGATQSANAAGYILRSFKHTNNITYYVLESGDPKRRPWGTYVFYLGTDSKWFLIESPHPYEEKNTSYIGIKSFIDSKSVAFLLSGSKSKGDGDVTLNPNSIFEAVHEEADFARDVIVLQIHAFNKKEDVQIILTSGTPVAISEMDNLIEKLLNFDFTIGIYDGVLFQNYGLTQDVQAIHTNNMGGSFIGIFLDKQVHNSKDMSQDFIDAIEEYTLNETTTHDTSTQ